jgi:hypothetical protein
VRSKGQGIERSLVVAANIGPWFGGSGTDRGRTGRIAVVAQRDPGAQRTGHTPLAAPRLDRWPHVRVVATEPAWPFDLSLIGGRVQAGFGLGPWTLIGALGGRNRTAGNRSDPPGGTACAAVREEPDAALLPRNPALVRRLSLGLRLPIAHDPAPLAALVDHSHVLLTSKDNEKNRGALRCCDPIQRG